MFWERIRQSIFGTQPGKYFTLPFLQTSYPYRSTNQRSRIGMRFPSSHSLLSLRLSIL